MGTQDTDRVRVGDRGRAVNLEVGRLWAGGLATAAVAALVGMVGILIAHGLFNVPVIGSPALIIVGAVGAIGATALVHALVLTTPSPLQFFGWIVGLMIALAAVLALVASATWATRVVSALIYTLIGVAIQSLVVASVINAQRHQERTETQGQPW